jgi:xanthine dehydrogenase accessory factor
VLRSGLPRKLHYGVTDETAWDVGLACGGQIEIFVEPLAPLLTSLPGLGGSAFAVLRKAVDREQVAVRAVVVDGPSEALGKSIIATPEGVSDASSLGPLAELVAKDARSMRGGNPESRSHHAGENDYVVFYDVMLPPLRLAIVGGVHIAVELARLAKRMGYSVAVVDPRKAFATRDRFPEADHLIHEWPDAGLETLGLTSGTAVAVLSHDPKLDDPALRVALRSPAYYVGALGSQRTQRLRRQRLAEAGLSEDEIGRLHGPIGLDLGARAPSEVALSILAEIVAVRAGRDTRRV